MTAFARNTDPETSHAAAASVDASRLEQCVLEALKQHGPSTCWELMSYTGIPNESLTPRMAPLRDKGLVIDTGNTRVGRRKYQIVWALPTQFTVTPERRIEMLERDILKIDRQIRRLQDKQRKLLQELGAYDQFAEIA